MTSKQRAKLRGIASTEETILHVGKNSIGDDLVKQAKDALEARELIKFKVLETCELSVKEVAIELARLTSSEVVQVIGSKGVLYRQNPNPKKRVVELDD